MRPTGKPPWGRFAMARSNIGEPVDTHSSKSVGVCSDPSKKKAILWTDLNFLLRLEARIEDSSSRDDSTFLAIN